MVQSNLRSIVVLTGILVAVLSVPVFANPPSKKGTKTKPIDEKSEPKKAKEEHDKLPARPAVGEVELHQPVSGRITPVLMQQEADALLKTMLEKFEREEPRQSIQSMESSRSLKSLDSGWGGGKSASRDPWSRGGAGPSTPSERIRMLKDNPETNPRAIADAATSAIRKQAEENPQHLDPSIKDASLEWDKILAAFAKGGDCQGEDVAKGKLPAHIKALHDVLDGAKDVSVLLALKGTSDRGMSQLIDCLESIAKARLKDEISKLEANACFSPKADVFKKQLADKANEIQGKVQTGFERFLALEEFGLQGMYAPLPSDPQTAEKVPAERRELFVSRVSEPLAAAVRSSIRESLSNQMGKCVASVSGKFRSFAESSEGVDGSPIDKLLGSAASEELLRRLKNALDEEEAHTSSVNQSHEEFARHRQMLEDFSRRIQQPALHPAEQRMVDRLQGLPEAQKVRDAGRKGTPSKK